MNSARNIRFVAIIRLYHGVGILSSVVDPSPVVTDNFNAPDVVSAAAVVSPEAAGAVVSFLDEPQPTKEATTSVVAKMAANIFFIVTSSFFCTSIFMLFVNLMILFLKIIFNILVA